MKDRSIDHATRRPQRYWYEDGLAEIGTGILFLLVSLLFFAEAARVIPPSFSAIGLIVVVFFGVRFGSRALRTIKGELTYPRTGEVRYRQPVSHRRKIVATAVVASAIAIVVALGIRHTLSLSWIPLADGLLIGTFMFYLGNRLTLGRFYLLAAVSAAVGGTIAFAEWGDIAGSGAYFGAVGIALLFSGGATLLRYLQAPMPPREQQ